MITINKTLKEMFFIMNIHGKDIKIFAGNSNMILANEISEKIGLSLGYSNVSKFSDGEIAIDISEVVRGSVFLLFNRPAPQ